MQGEDAYPNWKDTCGPYSNSKTNDRGLRLLEFARYNNLMLANTLGLHKASRRWTWHSPNGEHHNQIDYILIKKRFQSSVNIGRTRSFPKADIGSDHDLVLMSFRLRLKKIKSSKYTRMKLNLDKLQDPVVAELFKTTLGGKITTLLLEVEAAVRSLKKGKAAGVDNIPAELLQAGGEAIIDVLTIICNKIWQSGRSTTEQIFNLRIICEKHLQHQQPLYHVFVDFKKAFDRVWHAALWATMRKYNISPNLVSIIQNLYDKATSAVLHNGAFGDWFRTMTGVRQGCLLSPLLFNIFLSASWLTPWKTMRDLSA
ncbi:hypothetical protein AAFF_G00162180 [Aldrovandia affinis]|uniref:Reverse transcriptase domain-containing protein n=1 Tax=Aldrovandia affinis TaxID=143900 RepID=A0AAD7R0N8_9TELE|nr:hypothetical protein AAFF_G00162180 [Aldrovandia affinis]